MTVVTAPDGSQLWSEPWPEPEPVWQGLAARAILGAASTHLVAIEVDHGDRRQTVPIDSPTGAFIVGIEGPANLCSERSTQAARRSPTRKG